MRVLLTNDDGIHAPGIRTLAAQLACHCDVLVVAPENASSASSHAITLHKPLRLHRIHSFSAEIGIAGCDVEAYTCSGRPSDCVTLGVLKVAADNPVDLVISGVNDGCNVAEDLGYSGTVGAALEGAVLGVPSFAVSLDLDRGGRFDEAARIAGLIASAWLYGARFPWHDELVGIIGEEEVEDSWSPAALPRLEAQRYPRPSPASHAGLTQTPVMNVNIPGVPLAEVRGIRWTIAGHREYHDVVRQAADPRGRPYYWLGGEKVVAGSEQEGTDTHALLNGYVSVTPVSYDITNRTDLPVLKRMLRERMGKAGSQNGHE